MMYLQLHCMLVCQHACDHLFGCRYDDTSATCCGRVYQTHASSKAADFAAAAYQQNTMQHAITLQCIGIGTNMIRFSVPSYRCCAGSCHGSHQCCTHQLVGRQVHQRAHQESCSRRCKVQRCHHECCLLQGTVGIPLYKVQHKATEVQTGAKQHCAGETPNTHVRGMQEGWLGCPCRFGLNLFHNRVTQLVPVTDRITVPLTVTYAQVGGCTG